jgi:protein SCO1/2
MKRPPKPVNALAATALGGLLAFSASRVAGQEATAHHHNSDNSGAQASQQPGAAETMSHSGMHGNVHGMSHDEHAVHRAMLDNPSGVQVTNAEYAVPSVSLIDQAGHSVDVQTLLSSDRPLAVNFIFTTCTTICPVLTALMTQFEDEIANDADKPMLVSISIDPSYDTPAVLKEYAGRFAADWTFLTGPSVDVMRVLQSFDAYRGNKINHFALTLLRPRGTNEWTRVEGLTSAKSLADIWHKIGS